MLTSRIPEITAAMEPAVAEQLRVSTEIVVSAAKSLVPIETGRLRDEIHVVRNGDLEFLVRAGKEDSAFYGHIVEHGSVHAAPHPFLVPALEASASAVVADVRKGIRRAAG